MKKKSLKTILVFLFTALLLLIMFFVAVNTGGLRIGMKQLLRGMFVEYDRDAAIVLQLRFPRIIVAILGGALMSVSGVLMQAVMRNPLADPGIIGVTSSAALAAVIVSVFLPSLAYLTPIFSFFGGMAAFLIVYALSMKNGGVNPVRMILTGIAADALFTGLYQAFESATGSTYSGAASIINANITLKEWSDVRLLLIYFVVAAILCAAVASKCNLLALSEKTVTGLGVDVGKTRTLIALISVLTASIFTSVIGNVSFLGLVVPHISRLLVGSDHKRLIPYSALAGALVLLFADTLGRSIVYPNEISPAIIMSVIGGPVFIFLLRKNSGVYGK